MLGSQKTKKKDFVLFFYLSVVCGASDTIWGYEKCLPETLFESKKTGISLSILPWPGWVKFINF